MLIIHHAIINPKSHRCHWTEYMYQLHHFPGQQTNVVMAAHVVWLMAILPLDDIYSFQNHDYHWLGNDSPDLYQVNSILGLSRKMLHYQYNIRMEAKDRYQQNQQDAPYQFDILKEIDESQQVLHSQDMNRPIVQTVAIGTMEAYRLATRLYACGRLLRYDSPIIVTLLVEQLQASSMR
jgi:hypothetical protein